MKSNETINKRGLSVVSVSKDTLARIDNYCSKNAINSRKEFIEAAIEYFERTGYDLHENYAMLSPLENLIADIKQDHQQNQELNENLRSFSQALIQLSQSKELTKSATELTVSQMLDITSKEIKCQKMEIELQRIKKELAHAKRVISAIKVNLDF